MSMKIAILGYGDQGKAALEYWSKDGNEITICDANPNAALPPNTYSVMGENYLADLDRFDLLIRTPALHPNEIKKANPNNPTILEKVTTVTNEFFEVCPSKNIIGVTGTKGKGTTSTLIAKMLEASGKRVHLGGNIGIPPLSMLKGNIKPNDWVVLELANFQLIDLKYSPKIAVCLMVVAEHLDWHADIHEYMEAKKQLFRWQSEDDVAIFNALNDNSKEIASAGNGKKVSFLSLPGAYVKSDLVIWDDKTVVSADEVKLLGKHNLENVCAAITAAGQVTDNIDAFKKVLTSFSGLEHRLEFVRELEGIKYYDDSFGTTPETAIVAIEAFKEPKVVILGGSDKGASYDELAKVVTSENVRGVVLIGFTKDKIRESLKNVGYFNFADGGETIEEIVNKARSLARPGDVVLLSTGCASFGLFQNYKDRGDKFKAAVNKLT